jgi:hypothetical protein
VSLVEEIARVNGLQLRASGGDHALSPVLQVATDARFGRLEENFAEDPHLVAKYGVAAVTGLQGKDGGGGASTYLGSARTRVISQAKHYAACARARGTRTPVCSQHGMLLREAMCSMHSRADGAAGKDGYAAGFDERTLWQVYLRPWRA